MMDFSTPEPSRYHDRRPQHQRPAPTQQAATTAHDEPVNEKPRRKKRLKKPSSGVWKRAVIVLLVLSVGGLVYGYLHTKNQLDQLKAPASAGQTETQQLQNKVGKLAALPVGETPTIATVNDASKLKTQAFFANAKNGDKVLIFSKSGKAILYRPSTNQIVEYSTVNLSGGTGQ
jgi:uncharacterized protein HemX